MLIDYCERGFYAGFINSVSCRKQLGLITRGVAQKKISVERFKSIAVPLCSLPEQQEIVRLLDEQFTVIAQSEREIDAALKRSEALRQSILKMAFTGQLAPQDPTDEPASIATAEVLKATVVTGERPTHNLAKPKIPDVCHARGRVRRITFLEMLKELGWKF
ncbi:MAG: DUF4411 family protein [Verrucomicrobia bacterium]|nr:DUF4411 family protein [Verrucomicrobiota bacterium]MDA1006503.1 DUF4411 family protein [Verrucomicrobiota bacterium]